MDKYQQYMVNHNLQQSNNFLMIIEGDERLNVKDVTFYIKNFPIPDVNISVIDVPTHIKKMPFPGQGKMDYGDLSLDMLLDDNLNNYFELLKWIYRLKNPQYLWSLNNDGNNFLDKPTPNNIQNLEQTEQYPIDYRDINILIGDTNGQLNYRFNFADAFPHEVSNLQLNAQVADYVSFTCTFAFLLMTVFDRDGNRVV